MEDLDIIKIDDNIKYISKSFYNPGGKEDEDSTFNYDGITLHNKKEINHFFIQHFRIPKLMNYEVSVLKLLQIAYNAGQFKAERENKKSYSKKILNFYDKYNLDKISAFAKNISRCVPIKSKLRGGDYERKYLKYKAKYIKLEKIDY